MLKPPSPSRRHCDCESLECAVSKPPDFPTEAKYRRCYKYHMSMIYKSTDQYNTNTQLSALCIVHIFHHCCTDYEAINLMYMCRLYSFVFQSTYVAHIEHIAQILKNRTQLAQSILWIRGASACPRFSLS